jgi:predicted aminopeptidase
MPRIRPAIRRAVPVLLLCLVLSVSGCRISYLFHVAKGQIQLLNGAVPIKEALDSQPFTPDQRKRLLLVAKIKAFGEAALGLRKTGNYETVYPDPDRNPIYMLSASSRDRFSPKTWWFPIVGDMPYLGFFDLEAAKKERTRLLNENLDVYVGRAGAYSTLGWFKDPVTMNLIDGSTPQLVNTLLHEMTHATLYVNGQGEFNEGLAVLVGKVGAFQFFETTLGPAHPHTVEARDALTDERLFSPFLNGLMDELEKVYALQLNQRENRELRNRAFAASLEKFQDLKGDLKTRQFVHFGSIPVNNAYLMIVALYHRHFELFLAVLGENDGSIKKTLLFLEGFSQKEGDLIEQLRNMAGD